METDDQKLKRLKHIAGKRGYDIIQLPEGDHEIGRGWRLVKLWGTARDAELIFGGPAERKGASLDEIEEYMGQP
jgi:hypothetical protein